MPRRRRQRSPNASRKPSALDAAARVLSENGQPMATKEMIGAMAEQGYWESPGGKTPHATLYAAILREIQQKGEQRRFRKVESGKFALVRSAVQIWSATPERSLLGLESLPTPQASYDCGGASHAQQPDDERRLGDYDGRALAIRCKHDGVRQLWIFVTWNIQCRGRIMNNRKIWVQIQPLERVHCKLISSHDREHEFGCCRYLSRCKIEGKVKSP